MHLSNRELRQKQHRKIKELRKGLKKSLSEDERQAITCALYCWENLS
jgi:hypothetical protein